VDITPSLFREIMLPMLIDEELRDKGLFLAGTDGKVNLGECSLVIDCTINRLHGWEG
jgi:hypothetical protein